MKGIIGEENLELCAIQITNYSNDPRIAPSGIVTNKDHIEQILEILNEEGVAIRNNRHVGELAQVYYLTAGSTTYMSDKELLVHMENKCLPIHSLYYYEFISMGNPRELQLKKVYEKA